jgi:folate-binding protein YgfZ
MNYDTYIHIKNSAVFYPISQVGTLRITGRDRFEYLQRQTTNDVKTLIPGKFILSVLTTPTARIQDVFVLCIQGEATGDINKSDKNIEEAIIAITLPGSGTSTARFLKSRIFFMDLVKVTDDSQNFYQVDLFGPQAGRILECLHIPAPSADTLLTTQTEFGELTIMDLRPNLGLGYRLITPASSAGPAAAALLQAGATRLEAESYDLLRVEAGLPAAGRELSEEFTPLEVHLESAISSTKGCYTGQEIIARQITYDKVTRQMVGLRLKRSVPARSNLQFKDTPVGIITSATHSPHHGPIALAVIRKPYQQPGTAIQVISETNRVDATVVDLPFDQPEDKS